MLSLVLALALAAPKPLVVGYVQNGADLAKLAESLDFSKLTHLTLAFENPIDAEGNLSYNAAADALIAKARAADVRVLVSIGGPASRDEAVAARYADLMSMEKRKGFMRKLGQFRAGAQVPRAGRGP